MNKNNINPIMFWANFRKSTKQHWSRHVAGRSPQTRKKWIESKHFWADGRSQKNTWLFGHVMGQFPKTKKHGMNPDSFRAGDRIEKNTCLSWHVLGQLPKTTKKGKPHSSPYPFIQIFILTRFHWWTLIRINIEFRFICGQLCFQDRWTSIYWGSRG